MKTYSVPTRDEVAPEDQVIFDTLKKNIGFVPNLYAFMATSKNALGRYLAFQGVKSSLSNKEKEAINLVVSQINDCKYCQSAHTTIGKMNGFSEDEIIHIRKGHSSDPKLNALVHLAKDITLHRGRAGKDSLEAFYHAGYSEATLIDVVMQIADKVVMNYIHNLTEVPIDFPIAEELPELV